MHSAPGSSWPWWARQGSGKSSLLAVAAALIRPTSGVVTVDGQEATGLRDAGLTALRREKVGIIFQQPNLLPSLTAVDQLLLADHLRGKPLAAARDGQPSYWKGSDSVRSGTNARISCPAASANA